MPTQGNTYGILEHVQALMQAASINDQPAYSNTIIGGLKDYTDTLPVGVCFPVSGSADRYTLGRAAKIHDIPRILVGSVVSYANAQTAMQQLCNIRDAVTFQFTQSATLNMAGPIIVNIVPNSEKWRFFVLNGQPVQGHEFLVSVKFEYTLPSGPQS